MASVFPLANYYTKGVSLTSTSKTTLYTCGDQGEKAFDVTGLLAVASDGTADTVTFHVTLSGTEYVLIYQGTVEANFPLQIEGLPVHMEAGDILKATCGAASSSHPTHIFVTGQKTVRAPGK